MAISTAFSTMRRRFMDDSTKGMPNQITGPNAGGPRQFPIRTPLTARVGQFWRSPNPTRHPCFHTSRVWQIG
jgi:hypothetical protein